MENIYEYVFIYADGFYITKTNVWSTDVEQESMDYEIMLKSISNDSTP